MSLYKFSNFWFAFTVVFCSSKVNCQNCGQRGTGSRSVTMGGESPTDGEWPWMVAIRNREKSGNYSIWCSGFLIDRKHVLTAAHCIQSKKRGQYSTRIGKVNLGKGKTYTIDRITVHEGYEPRMYYDDIAVLTLTREVDIPNFNPVCLPDAELSRQDLTDLDTTLVGWGRKEQHGSVSNHLQQLSRLRIMSNGECNQIFNEVLRSTFQRQFPGGFNGEFLCSGELDACRFLSGGPLMYKERKRWFAVGLVSFGLGCGRPDVPNGYIRVSSFLNWIRENTKD